MSTSYYRLAEPVTSLRAVTDGQHVRLTVFVNHANAGTLTLREEETRDFVRLLSISDDSLCAIRTHYGGDEKGCVVTENTPGMDPSLTLVSEYGEIVSVAEIRRLAGTGKGRSRA
jgi:hypothetical protein